MKTVEKTKIAIFVVPEFNLYTTLGFLDPFRLCNLRTGRQSYSWEFVSLDGGPVAATSGFDVDTKPVAGLTYQPDIVVVSASPVPHHFPADRLRPLLTRWLSHGSKAVSISSGGFILGFLGLLDGKQATVHYDYLTPFAEMFPKTHVNAAGYTVDGNIMTVSGGLASIDLALDILSSLSGRRIAAEVARTVLHGGLPGSNKLQDPLGEQQLQQSLPAALQTVVALMRENIETPLSIAELCQQAGLSRRRIEELFAERAGMTPKAYYITLRLNKAKDLVVETTLSFAEISVACGYSSASKFSAAYRRKYGRSPTDDRASAQRGHLLHSGKWSFS